MNAVRGQDVSAQPGEQHPCQCGARPSFMPALQPHVVAQCAVCIFFAILFLQSSVDKITDRKGNLEWLSGHFASSPLRGTVPLLLSAITVFEFCSGLFSGVGFVSLMANGPAWIPFAGVALAATSLLMLFFGQRIAKDYAGAATLAAYFAVAILGLMILPPIG